MYIAADSLSWFPPIHEAVSGGGLVAMAAVCLIQYGWHLYRLARIRKQTRKVLSEITDLSTELDDCHKEQVLTRLENRILRDLVSTTDCDKATDLLLKHFASNTSQEFAALLSLEGSQLVIDRSRGLSKKSRQAVCLNGKNLPGLSKNEALILADRELRQHELWTQLDSEDRRKVHEVILLPICDGTELCSVVMTTSLYPASATRNEQVELARRITSSICSSVKQRQAMKQRATEIRLTEEMLQLRSLTDRSYTSPLDMVQTYLCAVGSILEVDGATLYFPSSEGQHWKAVVRSEMGMSASLIPQWERHELRLLESFEQELEFQTHDPQSLAHLGIDTLLRSALLVPLLQNQQIAGVFCFGRSGDTAFESSHRQLAVWAAQHLGSTLVRLQTIADIKRQAQQDGLTDLANRRTFDEHLDREIRIAHRTGKPCSLLLCDLDRFKSVNDTYGHLAGDEVLRVVARILNKYAITSPCREQALTARYGGEEMAIILPGEGESVAVQVADEIRKAVHGETVWWQQIPINVTLSLGVATFPHHARTPEELIAIADEALFLAKSSGRNRVCHARMVSAKESTT